VMGDYDGIGGACVALFELMIPLAIVGVVSLLFALGYVIYFLCQHVRWV